MSLSRRRLGRPPSTEPLAGRHTIWLPPDLSAWARAQPLGLSTLVRQLLEEARTQAHAGAPVAPADPARSDPG